MMRTPGKIGIDAVPAALAMALLGACMINLMLLSRWF